MSNSAAARLVSEPSAAAGIREHFGGNKERKLGQALWNLRRRIGRVGCTTSRKNKNLCEECRKQRKKCDGEKPCARCIRVGKAETCSAGSASGRLAESTTRKPLLPLPLVMVKPPLSTRPGLVFRDEAVPSYGLDAAELPPCLRVAWGMGHSSDQILGWLRAMPPELRGVVEQVVSALELIQQAQASPPPALLHDSLHAPRFAIEQAGAQFPKEEEEAEFAFEEAAECGPGRARLQVWLDGSSMSRQAFVASASLQAYLTGIHNEEYLARVANHEVPFPMSEVEAFCMVLSGALKLSEGTNAYYVRYRRNIYSAELPTSALFLKCHRRVTQGRRGSVAVALDLELRTAEQFQQDMAARPAETRPLLHAMGDPRSAAALLNHTAPHPFDTFHGLSSTPEGRQALAALTNELRKQAAPVLAQAAALAAPAPSLNFHHHHTPTLRPTTPIFMNVE